MSIPEKRSESIVSDAAGAFQSAGETEEPQEVAAPDRRLRVRYIVALTIVAGLSLVSQLAIQRSIRSQTNDAPVINVAGRQRMLSQRIAKAALTWNAATDESVRQEARDQLREAVELWSTAHRGLQIGSRELRLPGENSPEVRRGFEKIQPHFSAMLVAARGLLAEDDQLQNLKRESRSAPEFSDLDGTSEHDAAEHEMLAGTEIIDSAKFRQQHVATILAHEGPFLRGMHAIVGLYDAEAQQRVAHLKWLELALFGLTVVVLLLEACFVFEPAARTIRRQFDRAVGAEAIADHNRELQRVNLALQRANESMQREIEQRRQTETELRQSYDEIDRLTLIASRTRHSVVVTDPDGGIEFVNEAFSEMTGYSPEEVMGRKPGSFLQGELTDADTVAAVREHLRLREHFEVEIVNYSRDGQPYWILLEVEPVFDDAGTLQHFLGTQMDITPRKEQEIALRDAKRSAEESSRAKSEFLANMSHEIRTPLNGILGFTEILRRGAHSKERVRSHLQTIHSSGEHLLRLINDILDLSKIEAGRMEFVTEVCSPHQIISEVLSVLRVRAQEKCISLECRWTSGVPETIQTDSARLRQLLMNLVGNAIKFTETGGVTLLATVDRSQPDPRFVVEVRDTGIGIPQEHIERIFSPFDQADNSITRRFGGTGLGLAISRYIASALGGDITATSEPGAGSTFRVTLATGSLDGVRMLDEPMAESLRPSSRDAASIGSLPEARILLCEDGETNRDLIGLVLSEAGAVVAFAENGQQGLDAIERSQSSSGFEPDERPFDLILMDMQMPVLDGYSATRKLRESGWTKPIIALTAHAMRGDEEKCLAAGCSGYLTKPIDIDRLLQTVSDALADRPELPACNGSAPQAGDSSQITTGQSEDPCGESPIRSTLPTELPKFQAIIESFVDRLEERLAEMRAALDAADTEQLKELAHWLKGAGGTIGFDCFTEPARELEQAAKDSQLSQAEALLSKIEQLQHRIELPQEKAATLREH